MSEVKVKVNGGGVGFLGVLTIIFIVLKLCDVISWSWWWVTSPLWLPLAVIFGIILFVFALSYVGILVRKVYRWYKKVFKKD